MHRLTLFYAQRRPEQGLEIMKEDADREMAIFTEAIKIPLQERGAFLDIASGGDENLRRRVEVLLKAHDRVGDFLEDPPGGTSML